MADAGRSVSEDEFDRKFCPHRAWRAMDGSVVVAFAPCRLDRRTI